MALRRIRESPHVLKTFSIYARSVRNVFNKNKEEKIFFETHQNAIFFITNPLSGFPILE